MSWQDLLAAVDFVVLCYIAWLERKAVHLDTERLGIEKETLRFYSDFVASRTRWYAARGKRAPKEAANMPPEVSPDKLVLFGGEDDGIGEADALPGDGGGEPGAGAGDAINFDEPGEREDS